MPQSIPGDYPRAMLGDTAITERLEMLLVLQWLDEGRAAGGDVLLSIPTAAAELGLAGEGEGLLDIMSALADLEEAGRMHVSWPRGPGADARVVLSRGICRDAIRLFGD